MDYTPTRIASLRRQRSVSTQKLSRDVASPGSGSSLDSATSYFAQHDGTGSGHDNNFQEVVNLGEGSARRRLFDELSYDAVPGNLHLVPDSVISKYVLLDSQAHLVPLLTLSFVSRHGIVETVRQLATDLAEREAQLSLLRRQHEDREREMKKMLIESGVAVHQIDKRLMNIGTTSLRHPDQVIGEELSEAMETKIVVEDNERRRAALRDMLSGIRDSDQASIASVGNQSISSKIGASAGGMAYSTMSDSSRSQKDAPSLAHLSIRETTQQQILQHNASMVASPSSELDRGPLELATFVPPNSQPPPLRYGAGDLTDRYGFVYDKARKAADQSDTSRRSSNGANEDEYVPDDEDVDSLNLVLNVKNAPSVTAVSATTRSVVARPEQESVKLLLKQLSNVHDEMQKAQTSKWDEFLAKLPDEEVIERGELFGVWGAGLAITGEKALMREFKDLVYSGIPVKYRPRIWGECSGSWVLKEPGTYESLIRQPEQNLEAINQVDLDIYRTMPHNVYFRDDGAGIQRLRRVLVAFSNRNPDIGYCQGMNMIAAVLLLTYPTEEDAFWSLVALIENMLPERYFCAPLDGPRVDQLVVQHYLAHRLPHLYEHLVGELNVEIEMITFDWFLSCFTDALPLEVLLRIWDVFLCVEGQVYLFQVAVALFKIYEKDLMGTTSAAQVYSFMKNLVNKPLGVDTLMRTAKLYPLESSHIEKRRAALANHDR